jgi:Spy/CpxP family protein refolding chaperone
MKRLLAVAVVAVMVAGTAAVYAGEGCCGGMSAKGASCSGDSFSKLNLTPDQKTKVEALKQGCLRATSRSEFHQMFGAGLEKILTPEQLAQWQSHCDGVAKSTACPYSNSAKTAKQT